MNEEPNIVKIKFHGNLGKRLKRKNWDLAVSSVREAFRAVDVLSKRKLTKCLIKDTEKNLKYQIKVNNKPVDTSGIDYEDLSSVYTSELCIKRKIKNIDIIPVLEGSGGGGGGGFLMALIGVILIIAAIPTGGASLAMFAELTALQTLGMVAGFGLLAGGISMLLAKPPKFDDFREIESTKKSTSYLFGGPTNTANEGGPIPVGYGRLIAGSQVIQTSLLVRQMTVAELGTYRTS